MRSPFKNFQLTESLVLTISYEVQRVKLAPN